MNALHAGRLATDISRASRRVLGMPKTGGRSQVSSLGGATFSASGWAAGILRKQNANNGESNKLGSSGSAESPEGPRKTAIARQGLAGGRATAVAGSPEQTKTPTRQQVDTSSTKNRERGWDAPAGWMAGHSKMPLNVENEDRVPIAAASEDHSVHGSARMTQGNGAGRRGMIQGQWQPGTSRARGKGGRSPKSDTNLRWGTPETTASSQRGGKRLGHKKRVQGSHLGGNRVDYKPVETDRFEDARLSDIRTGGEVGYAQAVIMRLLKKARSRRDCDKAKRVLDESLKRDDAAAVVDVFIYSAAIGVFSKAGEWETALEILRGMKDRGVRANEFVYNQAITACGNGGQWRWAVYLLKVMDTVDGVTPDIVSYNAAISACGSGRQSELAVVLLREMQEEKGIAPNATSYRAAISACKKTDQSDLASDLLREMQDKGLSLEAQPGDAVVGLRES